MIYIGLTGWGIMTACIRPRQAVKQADPLFIAFPIVELDASFTRYSPSGTMKVGKGDAGNLSVYR
ncbi:hypothetical protein PO124_07235 [Bacillus licheniformis]|nr:hypothetical protein [Bacillus licheniformis]